MRKKIVAGNWKMNNNLEETQALISDLINQTQTTDAEVMIAPSYVNLYGAVKLLKESHIEVIAQNMHFAENGAFTGEISADMLKYIGINTVILGHSERRAYFNETNQSLAKKVDTALENKLRVIFCIGEELEDRKANIHFDLVKKQIESALFHLPDAAWNQVVIAYEPVWAIGTGETASPDQAQEMHAFIRQTIKDNYSAQVADNLSILYGGSCKPSNAKELFSKDDVDGGLIGGASLNASDFYAIVNAF